MPIVLAVDCPRCHVSRETGLCGYLDSSLHAHLTAAPRLMECRVCAARERRGLLETLFGTNRGWRAGLALTSAEVEARARQLLHEAGRSESEIAAMRLIAG